MTLQEAFERVSEQPAYAIFYFTVIPFTALIVGWLEREEGHRAPWKYLYSTLLYAVSIPGLFAITLNIYLFLFERRSIMETNLYTQVLPFVAMIATILIIRKNVDLDRIPGFDKLSGLVLMISAALAIMWFVDRTRIIVFSYLPFHVVILIFLGLLILIRVGWSRLVK
jgi:hypothetical protein